MKSKGPIQLTTMKRFKFFVIIFIDIFLIGTIPVIGSAKSLHSDIKPNRFFSTEDIAQLHENLTRKKELPANLFLIGHRGMGPTNLYTQFTQFPENTLESFKEAILLGADGLEFDVFQSKDGHFIIIHDDELWKNVYGIERDGSQLPLLETSKTYRVSQKTRSELSKLAVGPNKECPPTLIECIELIEDANRIRISLGAPPLFLNIDIKNPELSLTCFDFIKQYIDLHSSSTIKFQSIFFTSASMNTLVFLSENIKISHPAISSLVSLIPQISTIQIYGKDNVGDHFIVKNPVKFDEKIIMDLKNLGKKMQLNGIDCVLWDLNPNLVKLCAQNGWSLHLVASNFNNYNNLKEFSCFIFYISQLCPIFLKVDWLSEIISILNYHLQTELSNNERNLFIEKLPLQKPLSDPMKLGRF